VNHKFHPWALSIQQTKSRILAKLTVSLLLLWVLSKQEFFILLNSTSQNTQNQNQLANWLQAHRREWFVTQYNPFKERTPPQCQPDLLWWLIYFLQFLMKFILTGILLINFVNRKTSSIKT